MSKIALANWNGSLMPIDEVKVSVLDRAFLFGDAIYEAMRVYRNRMFLWAEHRQRLATSLRELRIDCDVERLSQRAEETLAASKVAEGLVYIQVTRGVATRTHHFPNPPAAPNELVYVVDYGGDPAARYRETGVKTVKFPDLRWARRDIKSTNLLGNCLAAQAAAEANCHEAILVEPDGQISEGTHSSVFAVQDGKLITAPADQHILPGITRSFVLKLARDVGIGVMEHRFRESDLPVIEELFLTSTTSEVLPIIAVDDQPISGGVPGPITRRLAKAYQNAVAGWLATPEPMP